VYPRYVVQSIINIATIFLICYHNYYRPLSKHKKRGKSAAEAPVTSDEMKELQDPLDFLRQYCIIQYVMYTI